MTQKRKKTALALLALAMPAAAAVLLAGLGDEPAADEAIPYESLAQAAAIGGGLDSAGEALLGIDIRLHEGWKTYWRLPWESGLPPLLDWSGSRNLQSAQALWPAPQRFEDAGGAYFGYQDRLVLPVAVRAEDKIRAVHAQLLLRYAVCKHVCIPLEERFSWEIPAPGAEAPDGSEPATPEALQQALQRLPSEASETARFLDARLVGEDGESPSLEVRLLLAETPGATNAGDSFLLVEAPAPRLFGRERLLETAAASTEGSAFAPDASVQARYALPLLQPETAAVLRTDGARLLFRNGDIAISAHLPVN